jgi:hypothetical protein
MRKYLKGYVEVFEERLANVTELNNEGNREESLFLLRVVWGVNLYKFAEA